MKNAVIKLGLISVLFAAFSPAISAKPAKAEKKPGHFHKIFKHKKKAVKK